MASSVTIAVAGATGAVGREVLAVLDRVSWRPERVLAAASSSTVTPSVAYGDENILVEDADHLDIGLADALILAVPRSAARALGERAQDEGAVVVDLSGELARDADVPLIVPWVNPEHIASAGLRQVVAVPDAPAVLLASVLGPLVRAGLKGRAHATILVPASASGRGGIDELSRQVVALFNATTPPRKIFRQGLAFDLVPAVGEVDDSGWTGSEARVSRQVDRLLGSAFAVTCTLITVPVFSGISADLSLELDRRTPPELIERILHDGGVRAPQEPGARGLPRPRRVEGESFVHAARVRAHPDHGTGVQLWLAMDNLRASAACAVSLTGALLRDQIQASGS